MVTVFLSKSRAGPSGSIQGARMRSLSSTINPMGRRSLTSVIGPHHLADAPLRRPPPGGAEPFS